MTPPTFCEFGRPARNATLAALIVAVSDRAMIDPPLDPALDPGSDVTTNVPDSVPNTWMSSLASNSTFESAVPLLVPSARTRPKRVVGAPGVGRS